MKRRIGLGWKGLEHRVFIFSILRIRTHCPPETTVCSPTKKFTRVSVPKVFIGASLCTCDLLSRWPYDWTRSLAFFSSLVVERISYDSKSHSSHHMFGFSSMASPYSETIWGSIMSHFIGVNSDMAWGPAMSNRDTPVTWVILSLEAPS